MNPKSIGLIAAVIALIVGFIGTQSSGKDKRPDSDSNSKSETTTPTSTRTEPQTAIDAIKLYPEISSSWLLDAATVLLLLPRSDEKFYRAFLTKWDVDAEKASTVMKEGLALLKLKREFEAGLKAQEMDAIVSGTGDTLTARAKWFPPRIALEDCKISELDKFIEENSERKILDIYFAVVMVAELSDRIHTTTFFQRLHEIAKYHQDPKYHPLADIYGSEKLRAKLAANPDQFNRYLGDLTENGVPASSSVDFIAKYVNSSPDCFVGFNNRTYDELKKKVVRFKLPAIAEEFAKLIKAAAPTIPSQSALNKMLESLPKDPFGENYSWLVDGSKLYILSLGPDLEFKTDDDIRHEVNISISKGFGE